MFTCFENQTQLHGSLLNFIKANGLTSAHKGVFVSNVNYQHKYILFCYLKEHLIFFSWPSFNSDVYNPNVYYVANISSSNLFSFDFAPVYMLADIFPLPSSHWLRFTSTALALAKKYPRPLNSQPSFLFCTCNPY